MLIILIINNYIFRNGIKLTLANGNIMTFPIEGNFKFNMANEVKHSRSTNRDFG